MRKVRDVYTIRYVMIPRPDRDVPKKCQETVTQDRDCIHGVKYYHYATMRAPHQIQPHPKQIELALLSCNKINLIGALRLA